MTKFKKGDWVIVNNDYAPDVPEGSIGKIVKIRVENGLYDVYYDNTTWPYFDYELKLTHVPENFKTVKKYLGIK